ncbi:winged helix-turn-helix transcriptional regulator [Streptomyces roseoverticillatus]|uniref:MarR family winged helix-turn-helix transcriptional regulator n=1 Tax=Streptomyces roseoverticillatus TaxID=66429 RepID=UPI001F291522|nr:MarR family winged helix-turn-helix transcriptional regulator [Streptomyces roseoverticillatus]MCF3100371.1 winged helix-turn-helix transcriptional regulator [Streptomyces roseoverticillatus]
MTEREPKTVDEKTADELLNAVGPAFGKLRRSVLLEVEEPISQKDLSRTLVLRIVLEAEQGASAGQVASAEQGASKGGPGGGSAGAGEVTVGAVARHLGVDPSVASRMVSDSISAGYLIRAASQQDGRRTVLHLSPEGRELMARFSRHQRSAFECITADWPEHERLEFARLMLKYVASQDALRNRAPGA